MNPLHPILAQCVEKAQEASYQKGRYRHYAIVTDKAGRVISYGANDYVKSHPRFQRVAERLGKPLSCYAHAEFLAMIRDKAKKGTHLYVARVDSKGNPVNSQPCEICWAIIKQHRHIKSVTWT